MRPYGMRSKWSSGYEGWVGLVWLGLVCIAFCDGAMGIGVVNGNGDTTGF